ncbi:DUF5107 domain-containing protein [candidate division KSB1 bacterium]|nr:DUF5107 domain-containing protein [candidate division KSB1 bacterium]
MNPLPRFTLLMLAFLLPLCPVLADITIHETTITIPTYGVDAPDPNPRFYSGRVYQGAQGRIYPYPMSDVLTNQLVQKEYKAVYLENEFIKICVLPQIGGRIFEAIDKTNGYHFFYKQSVIKPSLIGMLGAWISGGVEWNFPHHHRANTFMPMDYALKENQDGSVTLWLTEIEQRHRMKMLIGLTIWPQCSVLQAELRFFNRTPFVHSFLYFANPAVHVDSTYQVIFPPEVEYVTQHAKREFARWPIADGRYGGYDYANVDISWWQNLPKPVSFFAWDHSSDYFAGYDHGADAGVAYVADIHIAPGKKFFTFGCGDEGRMWDKMLTDSDGPYLELMAGAYSDNQPDYSWIQPCETKIVKQTWFPIRDLGGMSYANVNGALHLRVQNHHAKLNIITTAEQKAAQLTLAVNEKTVWQETIDIGPDKPFQTDIRLAADVREEDIVVAVKTAAGVELLSFRPRAKAGETMPAAVEPPDQPQQYKTTEELYLAGLRLDELYNPQIDPYPYYLEALKRDADDSRTNVQLGILYCKRAMWAEAEIHLQRAVQRLTHNYTRPRDGEAHYYLALAQRALGHAEKAYDSYYRAAWNFAWRAAAFYSLAELDCLSGNYRRALQHVDEALIVNSHNVKALNLKCAILRHLGEMQTARQVNDLVHCVDPLDYWALNERVEIENGVKQDSAAHRAEMNLIKHLDDVQLYLELATDYGNAGFYNDAFKVLKRLPELAHPLISYYLAFYAHRMDDEAIAAYFLVNGSTLPHDYCFPFRLETIDVLNYAIEQQPQDANAFYYLGNLLFDLQPERAIQLWQRAVDLDPQFSLAYRNLGVGYSQFKNDVATAITFYEAALSHNDKDARLFYELDVLYEAARKDLHQRLDLLQQHEKIVIKRDDALSRLTELYVLTGDYDAAIDILTNHHFNVWEGGGDIHNVFVDAHLLRGLTFLRCEDYEKAQADFQTATLFPDNLEVGRPIYDMNALRNHYFIGHVLELQGIQQSQEHFELASRMDARDQFLFYKGKALLELSQDDKATALFDRMIKQGQEQLSSDQEIDFFAKFGEKARQNSRRAHAHYLIALGHYGKGDVDRAREELQKAQSLDINNVWINYYLEMIDKSR